MVIEVPGMAVNANLDARNSDKGYLILMKQNEDMNKFYEWYDNCIVQPFFRNLMKMAKKRVKIMAYINGRSKHLFLYPKV